MKKTKIISLLAVALALGFLTAASVQAVPTTYEYTGNPFTTAFPPYTTSDSVTGSVTFASALAASMPFTPVTPTAFTFSDGVQTITDLNALPNPVFSFATDALGQITAWAIHVSEQNGGIFTNLSADRGVVVGSPIAPTGFNSGDPGTWTVRATVADTGSTLLLMTLTLMALGVAARQFKRAAA